MKIRISTSAARGVRAAAGFGLAVLAVAGVGCATQSYGFRPADQAATSSELGFPASRYGVPPESPHGEVYVTSFGTREVQGGGGHNQLVHVRMAVANQTG